MQIDTFVTHIQDLYENETTRISNGLIKDNTADENIRYSGSNDVVKNYVEFGNTGEIWRIIGIFNVTNASGKTEPLVKLVKEDLIGGMSWDSSAQSINNGYGVNEWSQADLQSMLNTYYIGNSETCTYCDHPEQAICTNSCNNTVTPINSTYASMIESVIWNTGAIEWNEDGITPLQAYNDERNNLNEKMCSATLEDGSENLDCNDNVERTTEWVGKIGLIYPSDWAYSSTDKNCIDIKNSYGACIVNNWLILSGNPYWTISPYPSSYFTWLVKLPFADSLQVAEAYPVHPAIYLKSNIQIASGDGSSGNPYKLK